MHDDLPPLGSTVGHWLISERLDSGSFGVVFRARRVLAPQSPPVAMKIAKQPGDPRFERETEALRSSQHPSIPRFEGSGVWRGASGCDYPYLTMESVDGPTLYPWFHAQPRSSLEVLQVVVQLAGALASAHSRGIVHRDVKGDNIRVTPEGRAVLLDWGSCWLPAARPLTDTPMPPGTSAYRPPEQRGFVYATRKSFDARWISKPSDDLYSLGVTLYRLVTGVYLPPCTDGVRLVKREVPKPSEVATVSSKLEALILRLLSDEREARGTAEQLEHEALALVQEAGPDAREPILPKHPVPSSNDRHSSSDGLGDEEVLSDTEPSHTCSERQRFPTLPLLGAAFLMGAFFMAVLPVSSSPPSEAPPSPWLATPEEVAQFAPDGGVGEEALSSVQNMPRAAVPPSYLGVRIPKDPLPGQKKPPCAIGQRVINGGCWFGPNAMLKPPCGSEAFEYDDGCYMPVFPAPRHPTSEPP